MRKLLALIVTLSMVISFSGCKSDDYKEATKLYESGRYKQAQEIFVALGSYKDSQEMADNCSVQRCIELIDKALIWDVSVAAVVGIEDYQAAFSCYRGLKPELKSKVSNAAKLLAVEEEFELKSIEIEIIQLVIKTADAFVEEYIEDHLGALRDTYERYDKTKPFAYVVWDETDPEKISGSISFDYSYRISDGRIIESDVLCSWEGTYANGKITIEEMDSAKLRLDSLRRMGF